MIYFLQVLLLQSQRQLVVVDTGSRGNVERGGASHACESCYHIFPLLIM